MPVPEHVELIRLRTNMSHWAEHLHDAVREGRGLNLRELAQLREAAERLVESATREEADLRRLIQRAAG